MPKSLKKNNENSENALLSIDMFEREDAYVILAPIAGTTLKDISIEITRDILTIKGSREAEKGTDYIYEECYWGKFSREIILPDNADPNKIEAKFTNNVLKITIAKK